MKIRCFLAICALLATACAEDEPRYAGVEFELLSSPPVSVSFEPDRIELVAGVAVKVSVTPYSRSDVDYDAHAMLGLRGDDTDLLSVYATHEDREFVVVGNEPGETCLRVMIDRAEQECIDVRVLPGIAE
jgi:hypothetical protein